MDNNSKDFDIPLNIIDIKDRRILKELFENGRASYSYIAKKVELSKEVVNYRIKRLIEKGILIGFNTVIDVNKLGWQTYFVKVILRNIDDDIEENIIDTLVNHPNIAQVLKCIGNYDLTLKFFVKDYIEVNNLMKNIEMKFKTHIDSYEINFIENEFPVPLPFFYEPFKIGENYKIYERDKKEFSVSTKELQILKLLSHKARLPTSEIAKEMKMSRELIRHHLKKLEKNKVILKYRPSAWSGSKSIGYSWYFIMLKLNESNEKINKKLQYYILNHPNMTYYYKSIGKYDVWFEIRLKTSDELNNVLMDIRSILKNKLKSHELSIILKEYKYTYFPSCLLNE